VKFVEVGETFAIVSESHVHIVHAEVDSVPMTLTRDGDVLLVEAATLDHGLSTWRSGDTPEEAVRIAEETYPLPLDE
jgi:hypothetical protein